MPNRARGQINPSDKGIRRARTVVLDGPTGQAYVASWDNLGWAENQRRCDEQVGLRAYYRYSSTDEVIPLVRFILNVCLVDKDAEEVSPYRRWPRDCQDSLRETCKAE